MANVMATMHRCYFCDRMCSSGKYVEHKVDKSKIEITVFVCKECANKSEGEKNA